MQDEPFDQAIDYVKNMMGKEYNAETLKSIDEMNYEFVLDKHNSIDQIQTDIVFSILTKDSDGKEITTQSTITFTIAFTNKNTLNEIKFPDFSEYLFSDLLEGQNMDSLINGLNLDGESSI